jgi:hypothetical protein
LAEVNRNLGRYELLRRVAKGGMGEIFLARMRGAAGFEKLVVIKTILGHLAEEEEFVEKFLDEGRIVVQLTHGNIVPVFDMGEEAGEYFIAMEYVPGRDLRAVLKLLRARGERVPPKLAVHVAAEVCKGLHYAHGKSDDAGRPLRLVHRDVSPSNVMISRGGEVKLIDFGIARATNKLSSTVSGRIQGKFCYMSPEQASGAPVDPRSDVFSVGVLLYEMLTGARPFEGDTDLESLELVRKAEYTPLRELDPELPAELEAIVARALARSREARYPDAEALHLDLLGFLFASGRPTTAAMLAELLEELYPEGAERPELASTRAAVPMSLDEALSLGLDELDPYGVDPMGATDPSFDEDAPHTATLVAPTPEAPTPAGPEPSGREEASGAGEPGDVEGGGDTGSLTPSLPLTAGEAPGGARPRRTLALAVAGLLALAAVGFFFFSTPAGPRVASVTLRTAPAGARVFIDGVARHGVVTPAELELELGEHTVRFELEGHEPTDETALPVTSTHAFTFPPGAPFALTPRVRAREVIIETRPEGARVWVGEEDLGAAPVVLGVVPGERRHVRVVSPGCTSRIYTVDDQTEERVTFNLTCEAPEPTRAPDAGPSPDPTPSDPRPDARPRRVDLTLSATPAGAQVSVDGDAPQASPRTLEGVRADRAFEVTYTLDGHAPQTARVRASSRRHSVALSPLPKGCLTVTLSSPPLVAHVSIDGERVRGGATRDGMVEGLRAHELPAGTHRVVVSNAAADREHAESVEVTPGSACAQVRAW